MWISVENPWISIVWIKKSLKLQGKSLQLDINKIVLASNK